MSEHNYFRKANDETKQQIHPVWRGIGCLITVVTPIISWAAAASLIDLGKAQNWPSLAEMSGTYRFSPIFYQIPGVSVVANYLSGIPYLIPLVILFILFLMLFSGIFAFLNAVLYRMIGPPRYGELDAPAPRIRTKRYKR